MKKIIILLFFVLMVSGCTSDLYIFEEYVTSGSSVSAINTTITVINSTDTNVYSVYGNYTLDTLISDETTQVRITKNNSQTGVSEKCIVTVGSVTTISACS